MSALWIKNTSESDPSSYKITQLQIKPRGSNRIHAEVMGSNPIRTSEFFLGFICSYSSPIFTESDQLNLFQWHRKLIVALLARIKRSYFRDVKFLHI